MDDIITTANRKYECGWCLSSINKGEIHRRITWVELTKVCSWVECMECCKDSIGTILDSWRDWAPYGPIGAVEAYTWAMETDTAEAKRYLKRFNAISEEEQVESSYEVDTSEQDVLSEQEYEEMVDRCAKAAAEASEVVDDAWNNLPGADKDWYRIEARAVLGEARTFITSLVSNTKETHDKHPGNNHTYLCIGQVKDSTANYKKDMKRLIGMHWST